MRTEFPHFIDNSMRSDFRRCEKLFWYKHILQITKKTSNIHLLFGKSVAKGLEVFRLHYYGPGELYGNLDGSMCKGLTAVIQEWGEQEPLWGEQKSLDTAIAAVYLYLTEGFNVLIDPVRPWIRPNLQPAVEYSFQKPIPEVKHPDGSELKYVGRFDMLADFNGSLFVEDEKTSSRMGQSWVEGWDMDAQFTGYCWGAEQYDIPIAGVIIRGIGIYKNDIRFQPVITYRQDWEKERWLKTLISDIRRMIQCWENDYWPYDLSDGCKAYGGCSFKRLCASKDPKRWIDEEYQRYAWNPVTGEQE